MNYGQEQRKRVEDTPNDGRRKVLRGLGALLAGTAIAGAGLHKALEIKEDESNLYALFDEKDKERVKDFSHAYKAMNLLYVEMDAKNIDRVAISAISIGRIDILRSFVFAHLQTNEARLYKSLRTDILEKEGAFTLQNLAKLSVRAQEIAAEVEKNNDILLRPHTKSKPRIIIS